MILAVLVVPLLGAAFIALLGRWPNYRDAASVVTALSLFGLVLALVPRADGVMLDKFVLFETLPGLRLAFSIEPLGLLFALVASGLWVLTSVYSIGYMRAHHEEHQTRFYACFALTLAAAMGIALAGNLFTLFIFYEAMTLATYPLVTHHGTERAVHAGRVYLGYLFTTSIGLLLLAIIWTWALAGTLDFRAGGILAGKTDSTTVALLSALYAFGIGKAALMPFHRWLPAAMVAPAPVSALLHAVAVVKAGVFAVMKVIVYVFGTEFLQQTGLSVWLMYAAAATIVVASLIAVAQDDLKARLAYSTVSQLSYVILGAALANSAGVLGGSMHILMHAFGKITLFFCAGAVAVAAHKTKVSEMAHVGRQMPITMSAFLVGSLSIIGLPPFGGSWSKWYLILGAFDVAQLPLVAVLLISSLLSIAYLMPIPARAFFIREPGERPSQGVHEAPFACVLPLCVTAAGCLGLFFFAGEIYEFLFPLVQH
ncbi:MAG TPA: monovalent cation/H+ antiporter subunit D family protein [Candidatus Acidoferrales bacterium]|nr:monovalent cation/H+ antiporter subunit D family protein [Candidatus Acidoferrales bacterium]